MTKEEAIIKLAHIIYDAAKGGYIPFNAGEYCAMSIAKNKINEFLPFSEGTTELPSLPSNLDEAEFEYAQSLDGIPANQEEDKMIYDAFKAGAEWMAEQGMKI